MPHRPYIRLLLTALLVALAGGTARSQTASEPQVKAAYLYHFAQFVEWPLEALPAGAPVTVCLDANWRVQKALEDSARTQTVRGHRMQVRKVDGQESLQSCHIVYAEDLEPARAARLLARTAPAPVLVVSDYDRFAQIGGTANFYLEDGRMRFAINTEAAQRARLRLSSRLLKLARLVKEDRDASRP